MPLPANQGVAPPEAHHSAAGIAVEVTHVALDTVEVGAVLAETVPAAGHALHAAGHLAGGVGWGLAAGMMTYEVFNVMQESHRDGLLGGAVASGTRDSMGWSAGMGAVLAGLTPAERGAIRRELPLSRDRDMFDQAVDAAERGRAQSPEGFAAAQDEFRRIRSDFGRGVAAEVEGWRSQSGGSQAFEAGRAAAREAMTSPAQAAAMRAGAATAKYEAIRDFAAGRLDTRRLDLDPHYRSGASFAQRALQDGGRPALDAELRRVETSRGLPTRGSAALPIAG